MNVTVRFGCGFETAVQVHAVRFLRRFLRCGSRVQAPEQEQRRAGVPISPFLALKTLKLILPRALSDPPASFLWPRRSLV